MAAKEKQRPGVAARITALAPEREIFVRAGGTVRFVRISTRAQVTAAMLLTLALAVWLAVVGATLWQRASVEAAERRLRAEQSAVSSAEARVKADMRSVDTVADELEARQNALDAMMRAHFGGAIDHKRVLGDAVAGDDKAAYPAKISALQSDGSDRLNRLRARQNQFASALQSAATERLQRVEKAIRGFGLDPARLARQGQGGPFIPAAMVTGDNGPKDLRDLAALLDRLASMESTLRTIPSGRPTAAPMETSSYGFRRDPFNGMAAFHAGIDFPGRHGQPILAASAGRVIAAGVRSGYGNCIDVDHGHGIVTRYAHLSGYNARVGDTVTRGQQIGRMGSTGRSTGTHLHFEVRINGAAVNPRTFLEARRDVLEVQQVARQNALARAASVGNRG